MQRHTRTRRALQAGLMVPAVAAALYGCADFLNKAAEPQGTLNETSLANKAGVEGSLIATYRALDWNNGVGGDFGNTASHWVWGSVTSDDAYKGSEATDQPAINDIESYNWGTPAADGYFNQLWRGKYEGIVRANAALRLLDAVGAGSSLTPAEISSIHGEALFLRTHFHFEVWRAWKSVPYYQATDADFRKPSSDSAEFLGFLLRDIDSAITYLPDTPRGGQKGRVTKWTARAYKGRIQAYAGQWAAARTTLADVRASGPYGLETSYDRVWTGYNSAANGPETILAYQASANDGEPNGNNANYGERLNFPHSGSPFGCCGFHQPSQNLVNYFRVDADGLPLAISSPTTWNNRDAEFDATATDPVDPRLDWTVGRDGVPYKDWGNHAQGWIRAEAYGGPYSPKKNVHEKASGSQQVAGGWSPTQQNAVNIHIFRYADALLLLAEAEVEVGSLDVARQIVNQIRTRAAVRVQGPGTTAANMAIPIADPASDAYANYNIGTYPAGSPYFANQAAAREAVRAERRLELAMEGQRFYDLRRYGTAATVLNAYVARERTRRPYLSAAVAFEPKHNRFRIPELQVELSKIGDTPQVTQNPGW